MKKIFTQTLIATSLLSLAACTTTTENTSTLTNKEKAVAVISSIESGDQRAIDYINPSQYKQHNLNVADGLAGFAEVLHQLPAGSAKTQVIRAFQDGDYTFTHTEYNFFGPKAGFDVFRFEEGKIVEHWDNLQEISPANASGRTQFDGATEIKDLDKTKQNKKLVAKFVDTILIKGKLSHIEKFIGPNDQDYLQHNVAVADGLSGLGKAPNELNKAGMPMIYSKNHKILGEGNFVLAISEGEFLKKHVAFYDLFRVENNKIVEHWDTIEAIPEKAEWKNNNGKFNFK